MDEAARVAAAEPGPGFSAAVLAGGASRRMGRDKALIRVGGTALVRSVADACAEAGAAEVFVVGGNEVALRELGLEVVVDRHPGEGPLGAIVTALHGATHDVVVVLACDLVTPDAAAIGGVVAAVGDADVVVPVVDGRLQTLHAAWRRGCAATLAAAFAGGARSVRQGIATLRVGHWQPTSDDGFRDVDTPDDLREHRPDVDE